MNSWKDTPEVLVLAAGKCVKNKTTSTLLSSTFESDELDVEGTELTDILAFDTEHKEEFETLLVDEEENYQRDVKSLLKLFVDIITPSHSKNLQDGGLL